MMLKAKDTWCFFAWVPLCIIVAAQSSAPPAYQGQVSSTVEFNGYSVVNATPGVGCRVASEALGVSDWDTICLLTPDVTNCAIPNLPYRSNQYCEVFYLCSGWVGNTSIDEYPYITLALPATMTNVTQVLVWEEGHRGWVAQVELLGESGATVVWALNASQWNTPSELYKYSPPQQPNGPYYAPAIDYRGGTNVSANGNPCLVWTSQSYVNTTITNGLLGPSNNFCRNPDNDVNGPWCWTASGKEYCNVPPSDICNDTVLTFDVSPMGTDAYTMVRITMKYSQGALPTIAAVAVVGGEALGCFADPVRGYWLEPDCHACQLPYKGQNCNQLTCSSLVTPGTTYPCVYGTCSNVSDTCLCYPGFFGASCANICPTTQNMTLLPTFGTGLINPSLLVDSEICSGNGYCDDGATGTGVCTCAANYATSNCGVACPINPANGLVCSGNGTCSDGASGSGLCTCVYPSYGDNCAKGLCGSIQCFNGDCLGNTQCACYYNSVQGFWSGSSCETCAYGYQGATCTESTTIQKTWSGVVSQCINYYSFNAVPQTSYTLLPAANSQITIEFSSVTASASVQVVTTDYPVCSLRTSPTQSVASCTVNNGGGATGPNSYQIVAIWLQCVEGIDTTNDNTEYSITVTYVSGCSATLDCGTHGYCAPYNSEVTHFQNELNGVGTLHRSAKAMGRLLIDHPTAFARTTLKEKEMYHHHQTMPVSSASLAALLERKHAARHAEHTLPHITHSAKQGQQSVLVYRDPVMISDLTTGRRLQQTAQPTIGSITVASLTPSSVTLDVSWSSNAGGITLVAVQSGVAIPSPYVSGSFYSGVGYASAAANVSFSTTSGTTSVTLPSLTQCTSYDIYGETYSSGAASFGGSDVEYIAGVVPDDTPSLNYLSLTPQSHSIIVNASASQSANVVFCALQGSSPTPPSSVMSCAGVSGTVSISTPGLSGTISTGASGTLLKSNTVYTVFYALYSLCFAPIGSMASATTQTLTSSIPDALQLSLAYVEATGAYVQVDLSQSGYLAWVVQLVGGTAPPTLDGAAIFTAAIGTDAVVAVGEQYFPSGQSTFLFEGLTALTNYQLLYLTSNTSESPPAAMSNPYPSIPFSTPALLYPFLVAGPYVAGVNFMYVNFTASVAGVAVLATAPLGTATINSIQSGSIIGGVFGLTTATIFPSTTPSEATIQLPNVCQIYDLFYESIDSTGTYLSPVTLLGTVTLNQVPQPTVLLLAVGSRVVYVSVSLSTNAIVIICILPAGSPSSWLDLVACNEGVKQRITLDGQTTTTALSGLNGSTPYSLCYWGETACSITQVSNVSELNFTTVASDVPTLYELGLSVGVTNVSLRLSNDLSGYIVYAIVGSGTTTDNYTAAYISSLQPTAVAFASLALTAAGEFTIFTDGLVSGTNYAILYYATDASNTSAAVSLPVYFTTAGVAYPPESLAIVYTTGTAAELAISVGYASYVYIVIKAAAEAAPTVTSIQSAQTAQPFYGYKYFSIGLTSLSGGQAQVTFNQLQSLTNYVAYVLTLDSSQLYVSSALQTLYFSTSSVGVTPCEKAASPSQPCTNYAVDISGVCSCYNGFFCVNQQCISAAQYNAGLPGQCACDSSATMGYWNGTTCGSCYPGYFGSACALRCVNGTLNATGNGCNCATHFTGTTCDRCAAENGFYGPSCDTPSPIVTNIQSATLGVGTAYTIGPYQVLEYSNVFFNITTGEVPLSALTVAEVVLLTDFVSIPLIGLAYFDSSGVLDESNSLLSSNRPSCGTTGNTAQTQATPSTNNNLVISCTSWSGSSTTGSCTVQVPPGYNYAVLRFVSSEAVSFTIVYQMVTGCCSGNGFCGRSSSQCTCIYNAQLGFYSSADQCATCAPGYSGALCTQFEGSEMQVGSPPVSLETGGQQWFVMDIQPSASVNVTLTADADCDLYAATTTRCGSGWTYYNGSCFTILAGANDCTTHDRANASCVAQGAQLATIRSLEDLEFFQYLFTSTGLGQQSLAGEFCSTRVMVDGVRYNPRCADPSWGGLYDEIQCNAEPSGLCYWSASYYQCMLLSSYYCLFATTQSQCETSGTGRRLPCQWVQYDGSNYGCQMTYRFAGQQMTDVEMARLLSSPTTSDIGTTDCTTLYTPSACIGIPYCIWNPTGYYCSLSMSLANNFYSTGVMQQPGPNATYYSYPRCSYLTGRTNGTDPSALANIYFGEMECLAAELGAVPPTSLSYGSAAVMCEKSAAFSASPVVNSTTILPVVPQSASLGVPTCMANSAAYDESCTVQASSTDDLLVAWVVCQTPASSVYINATYIRSSHFAEYTPGSTQCYNDPINGSWAGSLCTTCAPQWSGGNCTIFTGCATAADCSNQGICNTTTGLCECYAQYYGYNCSFFCDDISTCDGGSCNVQYQSCPGTPGIPRSCYLEADLCATCPGQRGGYRCTSCHNGYWDPSTNCSYSCSCNGQPCNPTTGACECFSNSVKGYWSTAANCSACLNGYYGLTCTVQCNAASTCSGHGSCTSSGTCSCNTGYYGTNCSVACSPAQCSGIGTCNTSTGACVCPYSYSTGFWGGNDCSTCAVGYWGAGCSTECLCEARGTCDQLTGACICYSSDELGYFSGPSCASCASGYTGVNCTTPTTITANQMGQMAFIEVAPSARQVKPVLGGSMQMFTVGTVEYLWAATGDQVAEFIRPAGSNDPTMWTFTAACNIGAGTPQDVIKAAVYNPQQNWMAYITGLTGGMHLVALRTDGSAFSSSSPSSCTTLVVNLVSTNLFAFNNTGGIASLITHYPRDAIFDPTTSSAYVLYRATNYSMGFDSVYVSRIFLNEPSDVLHGFQRSHFEQYIQLPMLLDGTTLTLVNSTSGAPRAIVGGVDIDGRVVFLELLLPTPTANEIALLYFWYPNACIVNQCLNVARAAYLNESYYAAVRVQASGTNYMLLLQSNVTGEAIKLAASTSSSLLMSKQGMINCSFIVFDDYASTIYVGLFDNGTSPGYIFKLSADLQREYAVGYALTYEQSTSDMQIAVAAIALPGVRQLLIANQLTRSNIMALVLYEVEAIVPNVVNSGGGTLVNVTGNGFMQLGSSVYCMFGSKVNQQLAATYVSSTQVICQAPFATTYNPCVAVPLEVAFAGIGSFTSDSIPVSQLSVPLVQAILPSQRGGLTLDGPLTIIGSGFVNTAYLSCYALGTLFSATFVSSTTVYCSLPSQSTPVNTTIEISLDGQSFSNNAVYYYFIGTPSFFLSTFTNLATVNGTTYGSLASTGGWQAASGPVVYLPEISIIFYDSAYTNVGSRGTVLAGEFITVNVSSMPAAPFGGSYGTLLGQTTLSIVDGAAYATKLYLEYPGAGTYVLAIGCSWAGVANQTLSFIIDAIPTTLVIDGTYDNFTTGKSPLFNQPKIRISDVSGNTVTSFSTVPKVTATVSPTPPCMGAAPPGITLTEWEQTCTTIAGSTASVSFGVASFSSLQFIGDPGVMYTLTFTVDIAGIPPLEGFPMYTAVCPSSNALLSYIEPNWITAVVGGVITVKGWGFEPSTPLTLTIGSTGVAVDCEYVDTCTGICNIPILMAARRQSTSVLGVQTITLSSGSTTGNSATLTSALGIKGNTASQIGFSTTAQAAWLAGSYAVPNQTDSVTANITCVDVVGPADCYVAAVSVALNPVFVCEQDVMGSDLFVGYGWNATSNEDVYIDVKLVSTPASDSRTTLDAIFGAGAFPSRPTVQGILAYSNLVISYPRSGSYVLSFSSPNNTVAGVPFTSTTYTISISAGAPVSLALAYSFTLNTDGTAYALQNDKTLGLTASILDVAGNSVGLSALSGYLRVEMAVTITPAFFLQPYPLSDIPISQNDSALFSTAVFSGTPAYLGSQSFDFSTATVSNLNFGILYNLTFSIVDSALSATLPPVSLLATLASCPTGQYSPNLTSTCQTIPVGGTTSPLNDTIWLFAQPGYWRPMFYSDTFYSCPGSNCLGGYWSTCVQGTEGPVCAVCSPGYGKQGNSCLVCPAEAANVVVVLAIVIGVIIVIIIMVKSNISSEVKPQSVFSIVIKLLLNHIQTVSLTQGVQAKIEGIVKQLFNIQDQLTPNTSFASFSCLTGWNAYTVFLMWMIMPIVILGVPGIVTFAIDVYHRMKLHRRRARLNAELARRGESGMNAAEIEVHIKALETFDIPEEVYLDREEALVDHRAIDAARRDLPNIVPDPGDFAVSSSGCETPAVDAVDENMAFRDVVQRDRVREQLATNIEAQRHRVIADRAQELFGSPTRGLGDARPPPASAMTIVSMPTSPTGEKDECEMMDTKQATADIPEQKPDTTVKTHQRPTKIDSCSICFDDYAFYQCSECGTQPTNFCELCWDVVHAPNGERASHTKLAYTAENPDVRPQDPKFADLYTEVMLMRNRVPPVDLYVVTVMVVIFLAYPSLMTQIALLMSCTYIQSINESFLNADYSISCDTAEYQRWVLAAKLFFFVYGFGIPLAGVLLLVAKRHKLAERKTLSVYGFLYSGYRLKCFYWEFVIMVRKMLVVFIVVFTAGNTDYGIILGMWLVLFFLLINILVQPFQLRLYWRLENLSLTSITMILNLAMLYQPQYNLSVSDQDLVTGIIFAINIVVLTTFMYYIVLSGRVHFILFFSLDGSDKISWEEVKLSVRSKLWAFQGVRLAKWGFKDPSTEVEEFKRRKLAGRHEGAEVYQKIEDTSQGNGIDHGQQQIEVNPFTPMTPPGAMDLESSGAHMHPAFVNEESATHEACPPPVAMAGSRPVTRASCNAEGTRVETLSFDSTFNRSDHQHQNATELDAQVERATDVARPPQKAPVMPHSTEE